MHNIVLFNAKVRGKEGDKLAVFGDKKDMIGKKCYKNDLEGLIPKRSRKILLKYLTSENPTA